MAVSEELGHIRCGGIPMAIGVQTDMATPALARYLPEPACGSAHTGSGPRQIGPDRFVPVSPAGSVLRS